jgi:uncharacterized protein (TIGR02145 family)
MKKTFLHFILVLVVVSGMLSVYSCKKKDKNDDNNAAPVTGQFTDPRDNKVYKTVVIGTQTWMAQNLDYITDSSSFSYNNSASVENTYGRLYEWSVAQSACPAGWHLPDTAEWSKLITLQGGDFAAGGKMKETGSTHWNSPNNGATNSSGFDALPGGCWNTSVFKDMGNYTYYWSSSAPDTTTNAYYYYIMYNSMDIFRGSELRTYAHSIRCVKG